nr:redoxin domain-containing protein [Sulfuritalea hydrogenivorans]
MYRRLFALAAAPPLICLLLQGPVWAAPPPALKTVTARSAPTTADPRLTQALAQHRGQPVVVNFWATWCEPCREEMPSLARLAKRWQAQGLTVLTVAVADNAKRVEEFLWEALPDQQTLAVLHDREQTISRAWGARMLPTSVVLDRRHRIVARGMGAIDWDAPAIDQQLKKLIN